MTWRAACRAAGLAIGLLWSTALLGMAKHGAPSRRCSVCDEGEED